MFIQDHHVSTPLTDRGTQNTRQQQRESAISHLNAHKARRHLQRTMDRSIHNVANGPSSSTSSLLQNLLALKSRGYQNAPGSTLVLSNKAGLPGGGKRVNTDFAFSSSSLANNYRAVTDPQLLYLAEDALERADQLEKQIRQMPEGERKKQTIEHRNTFLNRRHEVISELRRRQQWNQYGD